jgi:putative transcriptional regulator
MKASVAAALVGLAAAAVLAQAEPAAPPRPPRSLTGQLLVATEELRDPRFGRTVIYMVQHDAAGATGLIVNRPLREVPLAQLLERFGLDTRGVTGRILVHYGGPVEPGRGVVLHTSDYSGEGTEAVQGGLSVTSRPGILQAIAARAGPRRALFVAGYAGWAPGQLESEMRAGAWVDGAADEALIFDFDADRKWERAFAARRIHL